MRQCKSAHSSIVLLRHSCCAAQKTADAKAQRSKETQRKVRKLSTKESHFSLSLCIPLRTSALFAPLRQIKHVCVTSVSHIVIKKEQIDWSSIFRNMMSCRKAGQRGGNGLRSHSRNSCKCPVRLISVCTANGFPRARSLLSTLFLAWTNGQPGCKASHCAR